MPVGSISSGTTVNRLRLIAIKAVAGRAFTGPEYDTASFDATVTLCSLWQPDCASSTACSAAASVVPTDLGSYQRRTYADLMTSNGIVRTPSSQACPLALLHRRRAGS
jgi:hypothetical protein